MKRIIIFLLNFAPLFGFNQTKPDLVNSTSESIGDTVFLNENWEKTTQDKSVYISIIKKNASRYTITDYKKDGTLIERGDYISPKRKVKDGQVIQYYENGKIMSEYTYVKNRLEGNAVTYHKNGNVKIKMFFKNNLKDGTFQEYNSDGKPLYQWKYVDGLCISANKSVVDSSLVSEEEDIYAICDENPEFPGGMNAFTDFFYQNVNKDMLVDVERIVKVGFVVEKDGSIDKTIIRSDISCRYGEEALRIVLMMPKWEPGKNGGKPVRSMSSLSINFVKK